jgi:hypothetical protein
LLEQNRTSAQQESYDVDFAEIDIVSQQEEVRLLKLFFPERFLQPGSDYEAIKLVRNNFYYELSTKMVLNNFDHLIMKLASNWC